MKSNQILTDLMLLEGQLNNFSFGELTTEEAAQLKKSFVFFKNRLEEKVYGIKPINNGQILGDETVGSHKLPYSTVNGTILARDGSLLAKLHHELKAPMNEILGFVDLMKESALDPEQRKHIRGIGYIANNLSGILDQLQEYVQLATEKEELEEIDFNFFGIIKDTLFLCNALIVHKEVKLSIDIDREVPTFLIGDPSKLSQILLYLLGNTIKYITEGDIHLRIGVKEDLGNACSLQFKINHPGVGKAPIGLEQFYSCLARPGASNREIFSDAGLEMDIIKQLVKNLRGAIPAALTQEMDTSFSFNLPYAKGTGIKRDNKNMPIHKKNHLEKIWQECSGEVDLLEELIGLFKGSVLEFIGKLKIYLPLGEYEKIGSAARKVRASACLMRADSLLPIIDALLINCRTERDIHYFNRLYDQFLATYPPLEAAIDAELHLLKLKAKGKR